MQQLHKKIRQVVMLLILPLFFVVLLSTPSQAKTQVLVQYFHGNVRCQTCLSFEAWSKKAVDGFPVELADGRLQWQLINFDLPENKHYIKDYTLADKSLVLVLEEDGKIISWKNVEEFWGFGEDEEQKFVSLVQNLIADYLKNTTGEEQGKPE